ncbi:hypothetical protein [Streptomyces sp. NRRL B-1347]|uniref:hypothetical protein n=1 Tax=Streptomyces sp. NRRL B-1347 TaxID=1476877 RepID=UPI00068C8C54|nr:hypothetical protein [Streptomyces sp. NRRL B-1347]
MSEYQHVQFAVDAPLSDAQLAQVRALTTRARLTRHSLVNTYSWGNFKGDPHRLIESHYDAYLYFANWGTREVILRWPASALPLASVVGYCAGPSAACRQAGRYVVLTLRSDREDGGEDGGEDFHELFGDDDDPEEGSERWLPSITRARHLLAEGDRRPLYLAWLLNLNEGELDSTDLEPAVPPGLADLPEPLADLAAFLRIDPDLIAAAATRSPKSPPRPTPAEYRTWLATLDAADKDTALARLLHDGDPQVLAQLRHRFHDTRTAPASSPGPARTVAALRAQVSADRAARIAEAERCQAVERQRAARAAQQAQQQRLKALRHDPEAAWTRVGDLLTQRGTRHYAEVVRLLSDLAALADQQKNLDTFTARYACFLDLHRTKKALLRELRAAGPHLAVLTPEAR